MNSTNPYQVTDRMVDAAIESYSTLAYRGTRLVAHILDTLFYGIFVFVVVAFTDIDTDENGELAVPSFLIALLLPAAIQLFLLYRKAQTVGKLLCKIRIVNTDGTTASFGRCLARGLVWIVLYWIPLMGLIDALCIFRESRQTLHDQMTGTNVIDA